MCALLKEDWSEARTQLISADQLSVYLTHYESPFYIQSLDLKLVPLLKIISD